jgi:transcription initiation factor TFIIF subunit alpha
MKRQMMVKAEDMGEENADADHDRKIGEEGRKLKQSLRALEKNAIYESDDEEGEDPFSSKTLF